jgi:hypothetical protein
MYQNRAAAVKRSCRIAGRLGKASKRRDANWPPQRRTGANSAATADAFGRYWAAARAERIAFTSSSGSAATAASLAAENAACSIRTVF